MSDSVTKAELVEANTALVNEVQSLKTRLEQLESHSSISLLDDEHVNRIGALYPDSEREARLMGREEQVMLSAVTIALVKVIAESEGKEASLEFVLEFVARSREPYLTGPLNPQPAPGNLI